MEKLIIQIGAGSDHLVHFALNCDGIYSAGNKMKKYKQNQLEYLFLFISITKDLTEILKSENETGYLFDLQSLIK